MDAQAATDAGGERSLIIRARQGDTQAFQRLVEEYSLLVARLTRTLLADRALAEDAAQEAWIDVWRGLARFDVGQPFRPWLVTVVANRCRKAARGAQLLTTGFPDTPDAAPGVFAMPDVAEHALQREALREVGAALAMLSADQRRVLALRYFADLDLGEIALILQIPLGTVKSRLSRGVALLRERLGIQSDVSRPPQREMPYRASRPGEGERR